MTPNFDLHSVWEQVCNPNTPIRDIILQLFKYNLANVVFGQDKTHFKFSAYKKKY